MIAAPTTRAVYAWTNVDYPVVYNGFIFLATGPLVTGLKYKASVGLEVDKQQLTIAARPVTPNWNREPTHGRSSSDGYAPRSCSTRP